MVGLYSPKGVCSSHFPVRSQGRECTIYHSGRALIFLTDPSGLPWPHYHVLSFLIYQAMNKPSTTKILPVSCQLAGVSTSSQTDHK